MTKVQLFYGHVASNWGDLAINAGVIAQFRGCGIDLDGSTAIIHWPNDAFLSAAMDSLAGLKVRTFPLDATVKGTKEEIDLLISYIAEPRRFAEDLSMAEHDVVVLNAGEHFFESARGENIPDLLWRILPALAAVEIGLPVVQMPSTIGPFRTRLGTEVEAFLYGGLAASAFRENRSRQLVAHGLDDDRSVLLDPGFFVPRLKRRSEAAHEREVLGIVVRLEDAGIRSGSRRSSFVQNKYRSSGFRDSQAYRLFTAIAEEHLRSGGDVRIIVQTRADRELSWAIFEHLGEAGLSEHVHFVDPADFRDYLSELRELDLLVTSRFHAVILAMAQGVPSLGIYSETHGHKMPGLFSFLKNPGGAIRLDERDISVVHDEVRDAAAELIEAEIRTWIRANRSVANRWLRQSLQLAARPNVDIRQLQILAVTALYGVGVQRVQESSLREVRAMLRTAIAEATPSTTGQEPKPTDADADDGTA